MLAGLLMLWVRVKRSGIEDISTLVLELFFWPFLHMSHGKGFLVMAIIGYV